MNPAILAGILVGAVVLIVILIPVTIDRSLPDFSKIHDMEARKSAFFEYLKPYIVRANADILRDRARLESITGQLERGPMSRRNERWFRELAADYGMELSADRTLALSDVAELQQRVDIIPPSLALAQAALESGWGTSRFSQEGNNLYGIWCYTPGCGIVPERRPDGAGYEVKSYGTPKDSFTDYIRNLNTNRAYESLWQIREAQRQSDRLPTGLALSDGLYRYSEEGWGYVAKVQGVIESNNLQSYDTSRN
jgi:Bax protein